MLPVVPGPYFSHRFPGLDPEGDANGNGVGNFQEYAAGYDPAGSLDEAFVPVIGGSGGRITYSHSIRTTAGDIQVHYEASSDLKTWTTLVRGEDYEVVTTTPDSGEPGRSEQIIELFFNRDLEHRMFFRRRFCPTLQPPVP